MDWWYFGLDMLVWFVLMAAVFAVGYKWGKRQGFRMGTAQRIETLRKTVSQRARQAQADADVLQAVSRPRSRRAKVTGISRRGLNDE